jgi:DNA mismatch repair protein MutS
MTTPLRQQYLDIKSRCPGMILFFQIGDFYEAFDEDAQVVARELGVALTRKFFGKGQMHPLAGVPIRSIEGHLARLVNRGHKVAICEQVTPPGKGLVEREVTRIITPGTVIEPGLLEGRTNNYLASFVIEGSFAGLAFTDISTGEFAATEATLEQAVAELERIAPRELLSPIGQQQPALETASQTLLDDNQLAPAAARSALLEHFQVRSLDAFGCEEKPLAARAAGAIIVYLRNTQADALANLTSLQTYTTENFMRLDPQTLRNLEIFEGWDFTGGQPTGSLVATLDLTLTPMGGRKLRKWLRQPLLDLIELRARQDSVEWYYKHEAARAKLRVALEDVLDIERLLGRVRRKLAAPTEIVALAASLRQAPVLRAMLEKQKAPAAFTYALESCEDIVDFVSRAITDRPPSDFERGDIIRRGFSVELDQLRDILSGGKEFLAKFEARERERTGVRSLKVGYNKVFGYYIEITKPNLKLAPADYVRKQTLTNAERFFTLELKEHESLIANAKERILELESTLYRKVCDEIARHADRMSQVAAGVAQNDLLSALAECAARQNYVKPLLDESNELAVTGGRHPMIEERIGGSRAYVPNDLHLSNERDQIILLTAPNMAGKSVYLRQTAIICLLAQIGSFVPATTARLGLVDRIFTRVGLHDYTLRGHSSFMVEMIETAQILNHASPRSLILLDEIGRGTSTSDGLSIARSVLEYLHNNPRVAAKTLFATHYHELTDAADYLPRVHNFHLAVRERGPRVEYLHQVQPGRAEKSFGVYVAQLAGLPKPVVARAQALLDAHQVNAAPIRNGGRPAVGTALLTALDALSALDLNQLSPIEALTKLFELQHEIQKESLEKSGKV